MKRYLTLKNVIIFILVTPIWVSSSIGLYEDRQKIQEKIRSYFPQTAVTEEKSKTELDRYWAKEIMNGGYILHFRHAERDKWIDVHMYDALESEVHENGYNESRYAEFDYFKDAV